MPAPGLPTLPPSEGLIQGGEVVDEGVLEVDAAKALAREYEMAKSIESNILVIIF